MGFSMSGISGLGLGKTSMTGRPDDEERRKRMMEIIRLLGKSYPRISLEGIESIGKRYGLDTVVEPPDRFKEVGECVVAGSNGSFMVTVGGWIKLKKGDINRFQISYTESKRITSATFNFSDKASDAVRKHEPTARKAIMKSLTLDPGQSYLTSTLENFAKNLERLGRMDKLCGSGFGCFEAIAGVYNSLEKLYEHEKKMAMTLLDASKGDSDIRAQREVMCKKSGRPVMNPRKTVGLCLDYWMENRKVLKAHHPKHSSKGKDPTAMDIDGDGDADDAVPGTVYSLTIECEENPSVELYQSARISSAWISDGVEKQSEDPSDLFGGPTIDWLDPSPTYLGEPPPAPADGSLQLDNSHMGKLPNVRFVAKLDPPLVLPQPIATNLMASVNANSPETDTVRTYTGLLLNTDTAEDYNAIYTGQTKQVHSNTLVLLPDAKIADGKLLEHKHSNTLFVSKPELGRVLDEIPFSHPKQLVQMLPTLRQYAVLNHILSETFKSKKAQQHRETETHVISPSNIRKADIDLLSAITPRLSVTYSDPTIQASNHAYGPPTPESLTLDDLLTQQPTDGDTEMPDADKTQESRVLSALVEILPNGDIQVAEHNLVQPSLLTSVGTLDAGTEADPQGQQYRRVAGWLAKALDIMGGEVGCWTEAMARKACALAEVS